MTKQKDDLRREEPKYPRQKMKITVDIPPSKNHAFFYKHGKKIRKKKTKEYIERLHKILKKEMRRQKWKKDGDDVWYYADLYFYYPDKRRRDSHNCIEILMDGLEGYLFRDDYFVLPRVQEVKLDRKNPRMEMVFYAKR